MNYTASIFDFFKSPKWGMNLLLSGVCVLIPFVGMIVLSGWHVTGFWARKVQDPATFPDFDFNYFGKYLERGLWPFLAALIVALVMVPFIMLAVFMMIGLTAALAANTSHQDADGMVVILGILLSVGVYLSLFFVMTLVQVPLTVGATVTQDFGGAFNFTFFKRFISLMWKEMLLAAIFMLAASLVLMLVGMLACYVGMFFTMSLAIFGGHHLQRQLYDLYLGRGGQPLLLSPKLADGPPALPVA